LDIPAVGLDPNKEMTVFEKLLFAFYNRVYKIVDVNELRVLTKMADYYCALPTLSHSLSGAFFRSPEFLKSIPSRLSKFSPSRLNFIMISSFGNV